MSDASNSREELDLIERFISAYNAVDAYLQATLGNSSPSSFRSAVDLYSKRHRWWRDAELMRTAASLRNVLVHERTAPYEYPCVPTDVLVARLEEARDRLLHPKMAIPRFERDVTIVQASDTLTHVLRLIHALQFTHFPVYDYAYKKPRFMGVLTENGITRWLAEQVKEEDGLMDLSECSIAEVLQREERRRNYEFAPRTASVEGLVYRFHENPYLEAVLLTAHGNESAELLGIVTRWDALNAH